MIPASFNAICMIIGFAAYQYLYASIFLMLGGILPPLTVVMALFLF